jgi:hypothetical protein
MGSSQILAAQDEPPGVVFFQGALASVGALCMTCPMSKSVECLFVTDVSLADKAARK